MGHVKKKSVRGLQTETESRRRCAVCCVCGSAAAYGGSLMGLFVNYGSCSSSCHTVCIDLPFDCSSFLSRSFIPFNS